VHVARPPETQEVCPCVQLSVHISAQPASGAMPEHDSGVVHGDVEAA
jgi:hypothetical protein